MNYSSEVVCPGCKMKTKISYKKPHVVQPTLTWFTCSACESSILAKVSLPKAAEKAPPGTFSIAMKSIRPSAALVAMLKEEAEEKAKDAALTQEEVSV